MRFSQSAFQEAMSVHLCCLSPAFIKEDWTIESIKELKPYTLLPVFSDGEILYALEVNRGWFSENNINGLCLSIKL